MKFKTMEWCRTRARPDKNYSTNNNNQGPVRDEFKFVKRLGEGNMGTVFMAVHSGSQKIFAMKVMNKEVLRRRNASKMAVTEKEILSSLDHPFLPSLLTHFESENHTFLAMKYCSGGDINLLRHKQPNKIFSESAIRFYAAEVVMALEYLHKLGIVYRDLKPENILVQDNGHIMLTDFDLSLRLPSISKERYLRGNGNCDSFVGTEEYVAPEVLWGKPHAFAVDWWSFGVLLYEMSRGKTPFGGANRKKTFFNILCKDPPFDAGSIFCSSALKDLIQRLLVKDPSKRLRSASQVKNHAFFHGVRWNELEFVCRPPFVPTSTHVDELSVNGPDDDGDFAGTVGWETDRSQELRGLYRSVMDRKFPDCKARIGDNNIKKKNL